MLAEAEAGIQTEEPAATLATEPAPVIDEILVAVEEAVAEPVVTAPAEPQPAPAEVAEVLNEEQLLEALIREEEDAAPAVAAAGTETGGLSVEELQAFTLDDVEPLEADEEDEEDELPEMPALPDLAALAPDAGKIRFAEDLIDDARGARTGRRGRRGGGARGGARGGR